MIPDEKPIDFRRRHNRDEISLEGIATEMEVRIHRHVVDTNLARRQP